MKHNQTIPYDNSGVGPGRFESAVMPWSMPTSNGYDDTSLPP